MLLIIVFLRRWLPTLVAAAATVDAGVHCGLAAMHAIQRLKYSGIIND